MPTNQTAQSCGLGRAERGEWASETRPRGRGDNRAHLSARWMWSTEKETNRGHQPTSTSRLDLTLIFRFGLLPFPHLKLLIRKFLSFPSLSLPHLPHLPERLTIPRETLRPPVPLQLPPLIKPPSRRNRRGRLGIYNCCVGRP